MSLLVVLAHRLSAQEKDYFVLMLIVFLLRMVAHNNQEIVVEITVTKLVTPTIALNKTEHVQRKKLLASVSSELLLVLL